MNHLSFFFSSIIKIEVEGKNINNYIKKILANKINIYNLNYLSHNKVLLVINNRDYKKLIKNKTIYEIKIIEYYGKLYLLKELKKNRLLLSSLMIGLVFIIFLSNIIFDIEILHTNKNIIKLVSDELDRYNLKKYSLKKNYDEIEKIEEKILITNKDTIEWIEIDVVGTKYVINVEPRKINPHNDNNIYQHIVASKNAIITSIETSKGEKIKKNLQYVTKDEIVVSGIINKTNGEIFYLKAEGLILGRVWYQIDVEYPYTYKEELYTGNKKNVYVFNFLNKRLSLFNFNKFETFSSKKKLLIKNNLLPISFTKEKQYELKIINEIYTQEEVKIKAIDYAKEKLLKSNSKIKEINEVLILSENSKVSKIHLSLFISVTEDITKYQKIIP